MSEGPRHDAAAFWEQHYQRRTQSPSGRPNDVMAGIVESWPPGRALDLGCALGDDTFWLARRAWRVLGVDVSAVALDQAVARSRELGLSERVRFERHDLTASFPDGRFDLVTATHLESPAGFDREAVLRRATAAVAPGGRLLVIVHGSVRPWAWNQEPGQRFPTPAEELAALRLEDDAWETETSAAVEHEVTGPEGRSAVVADVVTLVRRGASS